MSRRNNSKGSTIFWIIVGILFLSGNIMSVLGVIGALAAIIAGLAFFIALLVVLVKRLSGNSGYTNVSPRQNVNRPTVNPYSKTNNVAENRTQTQTQTGVPTGVSVAVRNSTVVTKNGNTQTVTKTVTKTTVNPSQTEKPIQTEPVKPVRPSTGDPEIDKMLDDRDQAIAEMHRLNDRIEDPKLSEQIDHLEAVTDKIMKYIVDHPKKKKQVNKFFNFYLPTTLKLLNSYDIMDETGISGENIDGTKEKVEGMMEMALSAFDKQLDALFADDALDVSTDISVMANMLRAEGLTDDELMKEAVAAAKAISDDKADSTEDFFGSFGVADDTQTSNN